jgi:DNA-binding CsgD family transcriptional regulator
MKCEVAFPPEWAAIWDRLTPRQREVAEEHARGAQTKEIAAKLKISKRQVERHIYNAAAKFPANWRPGAKLFAAYAVRHGASTGREE